MRRWRVRDHAVRAARALALAPLLLSLLWPYLHAPGAAWAAGGGQDVARSSQTALLAFYEAAGIDPAFCLPESAADEEGAQPAECPACTLAKLVALDRPDGVALWAPRAVAPASRRPVQDGAAPRDPTLWDRPPGRGPPA
ncbi:MAG: hypothetical protein NXI21_09805 [Alphaproteobacteria bacterium]|nr:hypothetical protein [Alphaproteobacteria bacterium]